MQRIEKPWGFEELITLHEKYCFKRLFLEAGCRTSLQYHRVKHETMYFLSGKAVLEIHGADGKVENRPVSAGSYVIVLPPTVHRVIAEEDTLYVEASTPELSDLVRVHDDYERV